MPAEVETTAPRRLARELLFIGGLALAIGLAHGIGLKNGFLNFDDQSVVLDNPHLQNPSVKSVVLAFVEIRDDAYLPLYQLALLPDAALGGGQAMAFHLGSLLWHLLNACLMLAFLRRLCLAPGVAMMAAVIFAVHPATVESVAWVSGRKDQVSLAFLFIALLAWIQHLRAAGRAALLCALGTALLAGFAKGSAVVGPLLAGLLVVRLRFLGRISDAARPRAGLLLWFAISGATAAIHLAAAAAAGTTGELVTTSLCDRAALGLQALSHYAQHTIFPYGLSIHYHLVPGRIVPARVVLGGLILLLGIGIWMKRSWRHRWFVFGGAWWLLALLPFNNVFPRTSVALADRYLAISLVGSAIAFTAGFCLLKGWPRGGAFSCLILGLGFLTHHRTTEFESTKTVFSAAARRDPADPIPFAQLAEDLLAHLPEGKAREPALDEAARLFARALAAAEAAGDLAQDLRASTRLADLELRRGNFAEAATRFRALETRARSLGERGLRAGLDPVLLRHNRAQACLGMSKDAEGRELLRSVVTERPSFGEAHVSLALLDAAEGFALVDSDSVSVESRSLVDRAIARLEDLLARPDRGGAVEMRARYELVRLLVRARWRSDRLTVALRHERALAEAALGTAEAPLARALVAEEAGDMATAAQALLEAVRRAPKEPSFRIRLVRLLRGAGENLRAVATLRAGLELDPDSEPLRSEMADLLLAQGTHHLLMQDRARANAAAEQALEFDPESAAARALLGEVAESAGLYPLAEAEFQRALGGDAAYAPARRGLARCRQARGLGLLADIKRSLLALPELERPEAEQKLRDQALAEMRSAVELGGDAEDVAIARRYVAEQESAANAGTLSDLKARARAAGRLGQPTLAEELLLSALRIDPTDPDAHAWLAQALRDQARYPDAQASAERALALDPGHLSARKLAAEVAYIRGEVAAARSFATTFLKQAKDHPEAEALESAVLAMEEILRLTER